jgi:hypothetical protein
MFMQSGQAVVYTHSMDMQHGLGHAAWPWACSMAMGISMQQVHGHGYIAWT